MMIRIFMGLLIILPITVTTMAQETIKIEDGVVLAHPEVLRITVEELKQLIDDDADIVVVDTRDSLSYNFGHIPGAINIYYDPTADPMMREMTLIALPADKLIALYCPWTDEEESASMALELWQLGYDKDKLKALRGGSLRWEELDYPYESNEN